MSTISMMVDSEMGERPMRLLDAISALPHRRGTPPMERAPESIFTVDDEPELSQNDRDWLDCMTAKGEAALEGRWRRAWRITGGARGLGIHLLRGINCGARGEF